MVTAVNDWTAWRRATEVRERKWFAGARRSLVFADSTEPQQPSVGFFSVERALRPAVGGALPLTGILLYTGLEPQRSPQRAVAVLCGSCITSLLVGPILLRDHSTATCQAVDFLSCHSEQQSPSVPSHSRTLCPQSSSHTIRWRLRGPPHGSGRQRTNYSHSIGIGSSGHARGCTPAHTHIRVDARSLKSTLSTSASHFIRSHGAARLTYPASSHLAQRSSSARSCSYRQLSAVLQYSKRMSTQPMRAPVAESK